MKKDRGLLSRLFNGLLSILVAITILPAVTTTLEAANEGQEYVSLPITIRDYADDGMLFDYSDYNSGEELTKVWGSGTNTSITPTKLFTANTSGSLFNTSTEDGYIRYTSTGSGIYITYAISGVTRTQARYALLKYRTSTTTSSESPDIGHRWNGGGTSNYLTFSKDGYGQENFVNQVIDLGSGDETLSYITIRPKLNSGQYIDIAYLALFSSYDDAKNYNSGKTYNMGNNLHYGFLMGNPSTIDYNANNALNGGNNDSKGTADVHMNTFLGNAMTNTTSAPSFTSTDASTYTALVHKSSWNSTGLGVTLENGAKETLLAGRTRIGLINSELGANKQIVYKKETVEYLAWVLEKTLTVKEIGDNGYYNFNYIMGQELDELGGKDLATVFRENITSRGDYTSSQTKFNNGGLNQVSQVTTYYDAAYFLLHNIFTTNDGYGKELNNPYSELQLVKKTDSNGKEHYIFNSGYNNTVYDNKNGIIYNSQTTTAPGDNPSWGYGLPIYDNKFDPVKTDGYGITGSDYVDITGANSDQYSKINYNHSLEGHAKFIYYYDSDMYFTFTGDDDVYLFINGKLVMDLGGGHSISKVNININDVAEMCGLKDGEAYDFDFYYMERHGYAANFSIETNIKIVDPSMLTTKKGYQDGGEVGYNGYVNPQHPVTYEFGLQNNGESDITNLVFDDPILGVYLSKDTITLNKPETTITDLIVTKLNIDGTVAYTKVMNSEKELKDILSDVLKVGEKIQIYGIKYTIPTNKWVNNAFPNTVHTKATSTGDNTSTKDLNGIADYVVQKHEYNFKSLHYYDWGTIDTEIVPYGTFKGTSQSVSATKDELVQSVKDAGIVLTAGKQDIILCSASGNTTANVNKNAKLNADGSVTYTGTKTGADSFYYLVKDGNATYGPIRVDVYVYGVADNVFVLDYGLSVELNKPETSFILNDVVSLGTANSYKTEFGIVAADDSSDTEKFGEFTLRNPSLIYKPKKILNDDDTITVSISVIEIGKTEVTKTTGVTMTQTVKVAPANVVYYEDNFEGLTYVDGSGNQWLLYETVDENGNKVTGTEQSADQNSNYGSDPNYDADKQGDLKLQTNGLTSEQIKEANKLVKDVEGVLEGDASNGTIHAMQVGTQTTQEILNFTFDGTGFEILSRATSEDYAVLNVVVTNTLTNEVVKRFPVITECEYGDVYQVPVIAVKDMPASTYHVSLKAAKSTNTAVRMVYIDGIRIYGALEGKTLIYENEEIDKTDAYYKDNEKLAEFKEIKTLIKNSLTAYAVVDDSDVTASLITGETLIENREDTGLTLTNAIDLNEYLRFGPNNEIYLPSDNNAIIALYVKPNADVPKENRTIQIGAHRKSDISSDSTDAVYLVYGESADQLISDDVPTFTVNSGTEEYYTIDISEFTMDEDGRYLVLIGSTSGENTINNLTLTNIKIAGYDIVEIGDEIYGSLDENDMTRSRMFNEVNTFSLLRRRVVEEDTEDDSDNDTGDDTNNDVNDPIVTPTDKNDKNDGASVNTGRNEVTNSLFKNMITLILSGIVLITVIGKKKKSERI